MIMNNNNDKGYNVGSVDELKLETIALMKKIRGQIDMESSKANAEKQSPNKSTTADLTVLKLHEFKLKDILARVESMDENAWLAGKESLLKQFEEAHLAFNPSVVK